MYNDEKLWRYDHPPVPLTSSPKATPICFQGATRVTWQRWHCPRARRRQNTQPTNQAAWPYRHPMVPASATGNAKASFRKSCKCRQRRIQLNLALTHLKGKGKGSGYQVTVKQLRVILQQIWLHLSPWHLHRPWKTTSPGRTSQWWWRCLAVLHGVDWQYYSTHLGHLHQETCRVNTGIKYMNCAQDIQQTNRYRTKLILSINKTILSDTVDLRACGHVNVCKQRPSATTT